MIIQILDVTTRTWKDRCYCNKRVTAEKEVERLERIYKKNSFKIIPGKAKLPGPIYWDKDESFIQRIENGLEYMEYQRIDENYPVKMQAIMKGDFTLSKKWKEKLTPQQKLRKLRR